MRKLNQSIAILLISFLVCSCESLFIDSDPKSDNEENFNVLWNTLNERYSFFEFKKINWDSVGDVYRPLAIQAESEKQLFDVMAAMLNTLKDGHVNLRSPFDISRYSPYLEAAPNYSFDVLERNYLGKYRITGYLLNQEIQGVGYIHYKSFVNPILDSELDEVINRFKGLRGVIIDIRNNGGGNPANGLKMAARMINERTKIYSYQLKDGSGKTDFSEEKEVFLNPAQDLPMFPGKIVVLTNRAVYSAGSYFSAYIKGIPSAILMGDITGGGSGVPAGFELPNSWYFNFSSTIGYTVDGINFESGVPVDIAASMTSADIAAGKDPILERAIRYIKTGN